MRPCLLHPTPTTTTLPATLTRRQIGGASVSADTHNTLNQVLARPAGNVVRFRGQLNEPGTVTINDSALAV
ncbi:MAG: hypothetical protein ACR2OZ_12795 [Verrucomicrobiales bacterium]